MLYARFKDNRQAIKSHLGGKYKYTVKGLNLIVG